MILPWKPVLSDPLRIEVQQDQTRAQDAEAFRRVGKPRVIRRLRAVRLIDVVSQFHLGALQHER